MTALALALVACCAMVCGTVLAARRMTLRQYANLEMESQVSGLMEADANRRKEVASLRADMAAHDVAALRRELESLRVTTAGLAAAFDRNEQQIAALRADMAVRSIA